MLPLGISSGPGMALAPAPVVLFTYHVSHARRVRREPVARIDAVHDVDVAAVLEQLGLRERLSQGAVSCWFCGRAVSDETLGAIVPQGDEIVLVDSTPSCMRDLADFLSRRRPEVDLHD